jgi:hypothetical protein
MPRGRLLVTMAVAGLLAAPVAEARGFHGHGYHHRFYSGRHGRGIGIGGVLAGTAIGLGAGALIAEALSPSPYADAPPSYPPPPPYYTPPPYPYPPPY